MARRPPSTLRILTVVLFVNLRRAIVAGLQTIAPRPEEFVSIEEAVC